MFAIPSPDVGVSMEMYINELVALSAIEYCEKCGSRCDGESMQGGYCLKCDPPQHVPDDEPF
jgi:hypothetical protein